MHRKAPLTKNELKVILNEIITPKMFALGLTKYDGNYLWFDDFNDKGIKRVFHYNLMKGETGTFTYGNCFNFVPTYSNTAIIINHITDKSTKLHLFERTEGWRKSLEGVEFSDKTSHWGETECRRTINELLEKYCPIMERWWNNNTTIADCIITCNYQIEEAGGYRVNHPKANYVKAFLFAKTGDKEEAIKIINEELKNLIDYKPKFEKLRNQIVDRINKY